MLKNCILRTFHIGSYSSLPIPVLTIWFIISTFITRRSVLALSCLEVLGCIVFKRQWGGEDTGLDIPAGFVKFFSWLTEMQFFNEGNFALVHNFRISKYMA